MMLNQRMQEKLEKGEALDVLKIGREVRPGLYALDRFIPEVDYCDSKKEAWIWSIGRNNDTWEIFASTTSEFYGNPKYTCLWLR